MDAYCVNEIAQSDGDHEIHKMSCLFIPEPEHRLLLGLFDNCQDAVNEAKKIFPMTADGCHFCCPECDIR